MTIETAVAKLTDELNKNFPQGTFSLGYGDNTIFVYEHRRGLAKKVPNFFEGFLVERKYVGLKKPA
jgi:hypothetical protein